MSALKVGDKIRVTNKRVYVRDVLDRTYYTWEGTVVKVEDQGERILVRVDKSDREEEVGNVYTILNPDCYNIKENRECKLSFSSERRNENERV